MQPTAQSGKGEGWECLKQVEWCEMGSEGKETRQTKDKNKLAQRDLGVPVRLEAMEFTGQCGLFSVFKA